MGWFVIQRKFSFPFFLYAFSQFEFFFHHVHVSSYQQLGESSGSLAGGRRMGTQDLPGYWGSKVSTDTKLLRRVSKAQTTLWNLGQLQI